MFGQQRTAISTAILVGPFVLPMLLIPLAMYTGSVIGALSLVACFSGAALISIAKIPLWKKKKLSSFGWRNIEAPQRRKYFAGYFLLFIGILGCFLTLAFRQ